MISIIIGAILDWIASFFGLEVRKAVKEAASEAADKKANQTILNEVNDAKTPEQDQEVLDAAAGRLGRDPNG